MPVELPVIPAVPFATLEVDVPLMSETLLNCPTKLVVIDAVSLIDALEVIEAGDVSVVVATTVETRVLVDV